MSQEALADVSGVSAPTIKRIEGRTDTHGRNALTVERLARALSIEPEDLAEDQFRRIVDIGGDIELHLDRNVDPSELRRQSEQLIQLIEIRNRVLGK